MKPHKKGQQYEISYRCPGYTDPFYERFSTYEEANLRVAPERPEPSGRLGIYPQQPAERVTLPKYRPATRAVWSASEALHALDCCSDPVLEIAMLLALGCSMWIGEILGLTWDCVNYSTVPHTFG